VVPNITPRGNAKTIAIIPALSADPGDMYVIPAIVPMRGSDSDALGVIWLVVLRVGTTDDFLEMLYDLAVWRGRERSALGGCIYVIIILLMYRFEYLEISLTVENMVATRIYIAGCIFNQFHQFDP
jgi:hypothetical protein